MNSPALPAATRSAASAPAPTVDELHARLRQLTDVLTARRADLLRIAEQKPTNAQFTSGISWGIGALDRGLAALAGETNPAALAFQSITP